VNETANNFVEMGARALDAGSQAIVRRSANTAGVHVPSVNVDNIAVTAGAPSAQSGAIVGTRLRLVAAEHA